MIRTPDHIAEVMADWVMITKPLVVLDPGTGDGHLLRFCRERDKNALLVGVDNDLEVNFNVKGPSVFFREDFLKREETIKPTYAGVICAPPVAWDEEEFPIHLRFFEIAINLSLPDSHLSFLFPSTYHITKFVDYYTVHDIIEYPDHLIFEEPGSHVVLWKFIKR